MHQSKRSILDPLQLIPTQIQIQQNLRVVESHRRDPPQTISTQVERGGGGRERLRGSVPKVEPLAVDQEGGLFVPLTAWAGGGAGEWLHEGGGEV